MNTLVVGLDLGKANDPSAMAVLRNLTCVDLTRFPIRIPYPQVVKYVSYVIKNIGAVLALDGTGVGKAVADMFIEEGIVPISVTITGGKVATGGKEPYEINVPKPILLDVLRKVMQQGFLKVPQGLTFSAELREELDLFTREGYSIVTKRKFGSHGDLVFALALAAYVTVYKGEK